LLLFFKKEGLTVFLSVCFLLLPVSHLAAPADHTQAAFDEAVARTRPALWSVLQADPLLHVVMRRQAQAAYQAGGWPQAARRLDALSFPQITVYAGDHAIAACNAAWIGVKRALLARPAACRAFLDGAPDPFVARQLRASDAACTAVLLEGGRRRRAGQVPRIISAQDYADAYTISLNQPQPLTASERAALGGSYGDDRLSCAASLHRDENLAAFPESIVAAYRRREYVYGAVPGVPAKAAGPPGVACPPPGTVFLVMAQGSAPGAPARWLSAGQQGWDCRVRTPDHEASLWGEGGNPLLLLWPLAVGKSATVARRMPDGQLGTTRFSVTGFAKYAMPGRVVPAYSIDAVDRVAGMVVGAATQYWSPDLNWNIAQSVRLPAPGSQARDWVLVGVLPPGG